MPGLKADANMLQNHNHPNMNYLPFLMSKKWEAVHFVVCSRSIFSPLTADLFQVIFSPVAALIS
ncbi:hypothetical protein [Lancefieldella parvula]|uniref:hypothetical protein n=1 Tax=Lancefieldella parvula TaxID=1382 RepID=UPI0016537891|nr:hypothetical protein [Lancefieldella parvula]